MTSTHDLVAELVRAANLPSKLSAQHVDKLLTRAIGLITELRQQANIIPISGRDALNSIRTVLAGADRVSREKWHHVLRHAAEMIRDLHIVGHAGMEIRTAHRDAADRSPPAI